MSNSLFGILLALISTASWAVCSLLFKKLGEKFHAIEMTTIKSVLSPVFLLIIMILTGISIRIDFNQLLPIAMSGIIGIAIGDSLFFASLSRLSPFTLSLILFVGPDLFSGIFGIIFLREIPSLISLFGIVLLLFGLAFLTKINKDTKVIKTKILGVVLAVLSLICTSYSMVIIKPVLKEIPVITATFYRMLFSAFVLLIMLIISQRILKLKDNLKDYQYNIKISATILLATIGGFWLSLMSIKYCQLIIASSLMMLEPLFILIFMVLFYKYKMDLKEKIGILIIFAGIISICCG